MSTHTGHPRRDEVGATTTSSRRPGLLAPGLREVVLLTALWTTYAVSRVVASDDLEAARSRAADLLHLETLLHLDVESWLNHALTPLSQVAVPMSFWYASLHYLVTPAVLVFLFVRHRGEYARARNAIVIGSAIGLACYVLWPTAPPRLMPGGAYLDTLVSTSDVGWWSGQTSLPNGLGQMANELAAMPSLHVGWTVWVAWAVWRHVGVVGRSLAVLYSLGTTLVVVATGNHWVLDAVAGGLVIAAGVAISGWIAARAPTRTST
ncbi:phosphatase PAP2 family protein [Aeromicrobium sp. CFBP 8757]|uniref:phosphatase PAP2 family protein n=1 Tax=Aeromicrobium sp. CFBP 8757 TaxID=2775288 RepID=UPI00177CD2F6|nr:phosphatase PAP2 family protein [Aeromicrobium sp. CFBP 8757]